MSRFPVRLAFVLTTVLVLNGKLHAQPTYAGPKVAPASFDGDVRNLQAPPGIQAGRNSSRNEFEGPPSTKTNTSSSAPIAANIGLAPMPVATQNFLGLSFSDSVTEGRAGAGWPPGINGAVGPNHFIEAVNEAYAIYRKGGALLAAFTENSLWANGGSNLCNGNSYGDTVGSCALQFYGCAAMGADRCHRR